MSTESKRKLPGWLKSLKSDEAFAFNVPSLFSSAFATCVVNDINLSELKHIYPNLNHKENINVLRAYGPIVPYNSSNLKTKEDFRGTRNNIFIEKRQRTEYTIDRHRTNSIYWFGENYKQYRHSVIHCWPEAEPVIIKKDQIKIYKF